LTEPLDVIVSTRQGAHKVAKLAYERAQMLIADGKEVRIRAEEAESDRTLRQLRFYWGVVLKEISEQARINGDQFAAEAYHELCKRQFLGYEIKKVKVAGRKRTSVLRRLRSTTGLSVKKMSEYLEKVLAFGAVDLGVIFSEKRWEDYRGQ
jgi:hypothetical protein